MEIRARIAIRGSTVLPDFLGQRFHECHFSDIAFIQSIFKVETTEVREQKTWMQSQAAGQLGPEKYPHRQARRQKKCQLVLIVSTLDVRLEWNWLRPMDLKACGGPRATQVQHSFKGIFEPRLRRVEVWVDKLDFITVGQKQAGAAGELDCLPRYEILLLNLVGWLIFSKVASHQGVSIFSRFFEGDNGVKRLR